MRIAQIVDVIVILALLVRINMITASNRLVTSLSEAEMIKYGPEFKPFAWISITCPKRDHTGVCFPNAKYILKLKFVDFDELTFPNYGTVNLQFTLDQAKTIVEFVRSIPETALILVNCLGGVSRSTAVAAAITYCTGGSDELFWNLSCPNKYVFNMMCEAWSVEPPTRSWGEFEGELFG